jgi:autotransporter family porin
MDIRINKTLLHAKIKRFTLKATVSAIFALHIEAAMALDPCELVISDDRYATTGCEFIINPSVTVEEGGVVGGISMSGRTDSPTSIAINREGRVTTTTGNGIDIKSSTLSNGLSNNGTISSSDLAGLSISSASTINGGISNSGVIRGDGNDSGINILVNSNIDGDIINSGLIHSHDGSGININNLSHINGSISNTNEISSDDGNGILSGNVSSVDNISNSNSALISGGGLFGSGIAILSSSTIGAISNNGSITSINAAGINISASTVTNSISNSGRISGVTGIDISSTSTVGGGISNSGVIQGDTAAINISIGSIVPNINILGRTAQIIGTVNAMETNVNITQGAVFTSGGNYNVNAFNISQNAVFNMANTITVVDGVHNSGTLVLDRMRIIAGSGNYTQNTDGIFQTNVSSAINYGQLSVLGIADLTQSGNIYVQVGQNSSLHSSDILSNVIGGSSLNIPTSGFNVSSNSYIWKFIAALNNASNGVNLTATINPAAYNVCQGTYCQGAMNNIIGQVAAGNATFSPYAILPTASALQVAASQATPELTNENFQMIQSITQAVIDVAPMWSSLRGKSPGDEMPYESGKIWIKPYGASMTQNERHTVEGFNATAYGLVIGKEIKLSESALFGGAFAVGGDDMHGNAVLSDQSINSKAYQGMLYGARKFSNEIYFAGQALIGYENNNTKRSIPLYTSTAKASYNSWFTNIRTELGWSVDTLNQSLVLTPRVEASYLFVNQGSYRESGSPMDLQVASNNNSSLILGAYGHGAYHLATLHNQYNLTLTGYAGVARNVLHSQPQTTATFVAGGPSFSTFGIPFNSFVFRGGAGLVYASKTNPLSINLNYDLQSGNNAYSGIGSATVKYAF